MQVWLVKGRRGKAERLREKNLLKNNRLTHDFEGQPHEDVASQSQIGNVNPYII